MSQTTTVRLREELHEAIKREAARLGISFNDFVQISLIQYLEKVESGKESK